MDNKSILVVGGGMSGLTAALEAAEVGYEVILLEKESYLGGRVAQLHHYFPKLCPPNCGLEINFRRMRVNPLIKFYTMAEVEAISGSKGNYDVTVKLTPRFINESCTACGKCVEVCPVERPNAFNFGMDKTKAVYLPHDFAFPMKYIIDPQACAGASCGKCVEVCPVKAIELDMQPKSINLKVGAIIWATGWDPYDAAKIEYYGFGRLPNVVTNVMMERLAAVNGPTKGKITRPSDGKGIETIAFVQCAGSRDENHQAYCSQVCCLASLKQAMYVREQYPEAKIYIYYIDIRALGRYEDVYTKVQEDSNVFFVKGKVGEITENPETKKLVLEVEDQLAGEIIHPEVDMVVLATGMAPAGKAVGGALNCDADGFAVSDEGVIAAGCAKKPMEVAASVRDATAAALQAIQAVTGGGK